MRPVVQSLFFIAGIFATSITQAAERAEVFKTSGCSCCVAWMRHLEEAGYAVEARDVAMGELMGMKLHAGLKAGQTSCHSARIGAYFIEGHVPAGDIDRLLAEAPVDVVGLYVPDMPIGSPGMEVGDEKEPYEVMLLRGDGSSEVFARH